jgi:hypothetical protein
MKKQILKKVKGSRFLKSRFLGKQLSRLKMGQSYYSILMSTINAISLVSLAFALDLIWLLLIFPPLLLITYFIGYYLDKHNINSMDSLKSNEMVHRFLNTGDIKTQEFQLLQTEILIGALQSIQQGKDYYFQTIRQKYEEYFLKWKSPE